MNGSSYNDPLRDLEDFVKKTVGHRSACHSDLHMKKVFEVSAEIYNKIYKDCEEDYPRYLLVATVAWLHDVPDHKFVKYEPELINKVNDFLEYFTSQYQSVYRDSIYQYLFNRNGIMSIINRISFSKEKKNGDGDWATFLKDEGILIRNIVSDADKLEAIGKAGLERCATYAITVANQENRSYDRKYILKHVIEHYHEKLKLLGTQYIRTAVAKEMAVPLDKEMADEIEKLNAELSSIE